MRIFLLLVFAPIFGSIMAQPANDDCVNAIEIINLDGSCTGFTTTSSTFDLFNGECVIPDNINVWFSFIAQGPDIDVAVSSPSDDVFVTLVSFDPDPCDFGSSIQLACGFANGGGNAISQNSILSPGSTYYLIVNIGDDVEASGTICVDNPDPNAPPVPTMGQWGIMILGLLFLILGIAAISKDKRLRILRQGKFVSA